MSRLAITTLFAALITTSAAAQQLPLPKSGPCPPGTRESGSFCVSGDDSRTLAIPKTGSTCLLAQSHSWRASTSKDPNRHRLRSN
jgi:hypothetical protein